MEKSSKKYWENVWSSEQNIVKIDTNYYTNFLLHKLFSKFFKYNDAKNICEIGCAMSSMLLYFYDNFGYKINGFDYEENAIIKTKQIYTAMGYQHNLYHHNFFDNNCEKKYDIVTSFGVFEHFDDLNNSIKHTLSYLKKDGMILTVIPNMNGLVGFFQKNLNKKVYDIHIPYKKEELELAHQNNGYQTLFCNYYGIYQFGVVNISGIKYEKFFRKFFAIPGKILFYFSELLSFKIDSKYISPYVIYIGKKI